MEKTPSFVSQTLYNVAAIGTGLAIAIGPLVVVLVLGALVLLVL